VFKRYLDSGRSTGAIFAIEPSGKAERQITKPGAGVVDDQPDWSRDGSLLVFHRTGTPWAIFRVKSDGSDLVRLSPPSEDGEGASFLPDGEHVVYTRATGKERSFPNGETWIQYSDIVVRDVNGGSLLVLIRSRPYEGSYLSAHFAPDGSRFVYVRQNSPITARAR
jgi:Tol biopolymer transport system component